MRFSYVLAGMLVFFFYACNNTSDTPNEPEVEEKEPIMPQNFELTLGFKDFHDSIGVERNIQLKDDSLLFVKANWGHHSDEPVERKGVEVKPEHKDIIFKVIESLDLDANYEKGYPGEKKINHFARFKMARNKTVVRGGEAYVDDHIAGELEHFGVFLEKIINGKEEDFLRMSTEFLE